MRCIFHHARFALAAFVVSSIFQASPALGKRRALILESSLGSKRALRLQLSAERLTYRPRASGCGRSVCLPALSLEGKVWVVARERAGGKGVLSLRCRKLEISLDARGRLVDLRGHGGLTVVAGKLRGTAGSATMNASRRLELTKARLKHAGLGLEIAGDRIIVLASGELTVHRARADLRWLGRHAK